MIFLSERMECQFTFALRWMLQRVLFIKSNSKEGNVYIIEINTIPALLGICSLLGAE